MKELLIKVASIQENIGKISKDSTNPYHESKYFDINQLLENLHPFLVANKLMLLQPIVDGKVVTKFICLETEQVLESSVALPVNENNPQKIGSAITYYRRYGIVSLLGLQADDDDGNKAAKPTPPAPTVPVLTDANITSCIEKGTQKKLLQDIDKKKYIASTKQIIELSK